MEKELVKRIYTASCALNSLSMAACKNVGLKQNVALLIYILYNDQPCSQKQICEKWLFPKTTVNTIVKECKNTGLIKFDDICIIKKERNLVLTEKGEELARKLFIDLYEIDNIAMRKTIIEYGGKFVEAFENYVDNYRKLLIEWDKREGSKNE